MTIQERDSMRSDGGRRGPLPLAQAAPRKARRTLKWTGVLGVLLAVMSVASGALWLAKDARGLFRPVGPVEGSLIVNINAATAQELESLPGIGPALAQLIIAGRPYATVDDIERVRGIGPRLVERLRPFLKTEGHTERR